MSKNYELAKGMKMVKDYKLIEEIGKGTSAIVYKAWDNKYKRLVAVKSISNTFLKNEDNIKHFHNELKSLDRLKHDNIIKMYSLERTANNHYICLEYCNGGSLNDLLNYYKFVYNNGLPENLIQQIILQLIRGLDYMNTKKHMHRDLKLDNVLLNFSEEIVNLDYSFQEEKGFKNMRIIIADLGYTRELEGHDNASTLCGTPYFMSPDILKMDKIGYNIKSDLWSLGTITYTLATGDYPFEANSLKDLSDKINNAKYVYKTKKSCMYSYELISFINGLLTYDQNSRFSFSEMKDHPFIKNDPNLFHPLDLNVIPKESLSKDKNQFEVDGKNLNNFLWVMLKSNDIKNLDKLKAEDIENKNIMESICIINKNLTEDKKDLLSKFKKMKKINAEIIEKSTNKDLEPVQKIEMNLDLNKSNDFNKNFILREDEKKVEEIKIEENSNKKLENDNTIQNLNSNESQSSYVKINNQEDEFVINEEAYSFIDENYYDFPKGFYDVNILEEILIDESYLSSKLVK